MAYDRDHERLPRQPGSGAILIANYHTFACASTRKLIPTMESGWGGQARAMVTGHLPLHGHAEVINVEDYEFSAGIKPLGDVPGPQSPGVKANRKFSGIIGRRRINSAPAVSTQQWVSGK